MLGTNEFVTTKSVERTDSGLHQYLVKVFNYMGFGLCITALTAWIFANTPAINLLYNFDQATNSISVSATGWIIVLAPLFLVFALGNALTSKSIGTVRLLFTVYSALIGASLSTILIAYTATSITRVFLITAATFGAMTIYGYSTKRDLSGIGSFLYMGLIGIIIASLVNFFMKSTGLHYAISYISVIIFVGLTACDMQKIKSLYYSSDDEETLSRKAIGGALSLYMDFINLFIYLMRILGDRK